MKEEIEKLLRYYGMEWNDSEECASKIIDYLESKQANKFTEDQIKEAWMDGCGAGESRVGKFDINNYID